MRIQHNIMAMNAYRNYNNNASALSKNLEKLSSGYRINRAGDDAAGLAISEKMRAQITGLDAAQKNVQDGISLVKTAEGAMQEIQDMLNRMVYLATQSANGTYEDEVDRENLQKEVDALMDEINRISDSANFNGRKLLDGSLGLQASTSMQELEALDSIDMADGITINAPEDGAGKNQTFELNFDPSDTATSDIVFAGGDKVAFKFTDADGNVTDLEFSHGTANNATTFKGTMADLAQAINAKLGNAHDYSASVLTNSAGKAVGVQLVAKAQGEDGGSFSDLVTTDSHITISNTKTAGVSNSAANTPIVPANIDGTAMGWNNLIAPAAAGNDAPALAEGDTIKFVFTVNGKDMNVTLTAGEDFAIGDKISTTTTNIAAALNNATFDADDTTKTVNEELFKVSDYVTVNANTKNDGTASTNGSLEVKAVTTDNHAVTIKDATITTGPNSGGSAGTTQTVTKAVTNPATAWTAIESDSTAEKVVLGNITTNFSAGEKLVLAGTLKDGRGFTVELEAVTGTASGNQFQIGSNVSNTLDKIISALTSGTAKATIDGTTDTIDAKEIFGTGKDFTVAKNSTNNGLEITNVTKGLTGKGLAAKLDETRCRVDTHAAVTGELTMTAEGREQSTSENKLTFDPALVEQGTTIEIDGKTYEFVTDADYTTHEDNIAVVVDGLGDTATAKDIAQALADTMASSGTYTSEAGNTYNLTVDDTSLTINSTVIGDGAVALDVEMLESKESAVVNFLSEESTSVEGVTTSTLNLKAGDTITVNGQVYEFTDGKRTNDENAIGVSITGITTAEDAAQALADAVNTFEQGKTGGYETIARADGASVVFTSRYDGTVAADANPYAAPEVELPASANGLTLQIGDTSDDYNQLNVSVNDMHTTALGLDDISIASQESAQAAIDVIRSAINHVSSTRGDLGAIQNRLEHTANNLSVMEENIQNAESAIRDTDIADEMTAYTKNNILLQSAQAMLAQANQVPQGVLQLLQ